MLLAALASAISGAALAEALTADAALSFYLLQTGRPEQAAWNAAAALHQDPGDLLAHRAYLAATVTGLRAGEQVTGLYREWAAEAEGEEAIAARLGLAEALYFGHDRIGAWCDELEAALEGAEGWALEARYWGLRTRYEARRRCPGDRAADRAALLALGEPGEDFVDRALGYGVRLRLTEGEPVDQELAGDLERWYAMAPEMASYPGSLWREDLEGEALERARAAAVEAALGSIEGDDPAAIYSAERVLAWAEHPGHPAALARLDALDPERGRTVQRSSGDARWFPREVIPHSPTRGMIYAADRKIAVRAVRILKGLEVDPAAEAPQTVALHQQKLAENLAYSGRRRAALEAFRRAWEADPTPARANDYAYAAARQGRELEQALAAMDAALASAATWDPRGGSTARDYDDWVREQRADRASWLDTRAWVLHALGRDQEAAADLREAALLAPEPVAVHHLHLGIVYHALEQPEAALFHLGRGLSMEEDLPGWEWSTRSEARGLARDLYEALRWAPGGLDDWIASQRPPETSALDGGGSDEADYRIGRPFPAELSFELDGQRRTIADFPGLVVVDLWATWCGPCVKALPHLSEVARDNPDVTVLAISVDRERAALEDFKDRPPRPAYVEAWAGQEGQQAARVGGIPATFVVRDGVVVGFYTGWGPGDDRLEPILAEQR